MTIHRTGSSLATLLGAALTIAAPLAGSQEPAPERLGGAQQSRDSRR